MSLEKRVFLVDVDNTLIDTDGVKNRWHKTFGNKFLKSYNLSKSASGYLDVDMLADRLSVKSDYFYKTPFTNFLFPYAKNFLKNIKKLGKVIIFSLGQGKYQKLKIDKSGIKRIVGRGNAIVTGNKLLYLPKIIKKLKSEGYTDIFIIDDRSSVLETTYRTDPNVQTIWIKYGGYKKIGPADALSISFQADSLPEVNYLLKNFVAEIKTKQTKSRLSVLKNINEEQITELIKLSKNDMKVRKFTQDTKRFNSKKSFDLWKKQGKVIYTLTDAGQKLLGIIWFSKKIFKKYKYAFAIRTYPPARDKGLSNEFMKICFKNFRKRGIWLTTLPSNKSAIAVYKKFGFKEDYLKNGRLVMTLE